MVKRSEEIKVAANGFLSGVGIPSFLQLIEADKKTCTVHVNSQEKHGSLYFMNGELRNAETDTLKGEAAANEIVCWDDASVKIDLYKKGSKSILSSLGHILIDSFRIKDEKENEFNDEEIQQESLLRQDEESNELSIKYENLEIMETKDNYKIKTKEEHMNVSKLGKAIETMKENLDGGLLASDIFGATDMISVAGFNSNPSACALFGQIIASTNKALKGAKFPIIGRYFLIDLTDNKMVLLIPMGDYVWGNLIDGKKAQLGLLLNIALPQAIIAFEEAITS